MALLHMITFTNTAILMYIVYMLYQLTTQPKKTKKKVRFNDHIQIHEIPNTASKSYSDIPTNPHMKFVSNRWSTRSKPLNIPSTP